MDTALGTIIEVMRQRDKHLLAQWVSQILPDLPKGARIGEAEVRGQATEFAQLLVQAITTSGGSDTNTAAWEDVRAFLKRVSASRAEQGFTSSQTATFIFSLKRPLFTLLQEELKDKPAELAEAMWVATELLDRLGMLTVAAYQQTREQLITRQQEEMLELSTPVVKLWDGILALPMIGTLDSARTQTVMETLLERIVETGSEIAIIDITGVPTVDTLVAQHLLKTATAIRLMGADCIVSGIRPQIAQTIVHLGIEMGDIATKATLADALELALKRQGATFVRTHPKGDAS
jgi:rsbT co-antagonist protein RsbR